MFNIQVKYDQPLNKWLNLIDLLFDTPDFKSHKMRYNPMIQWEDKIFHSDIDEIVMDIMATKRSNFKPEDCVYMLRLRTKIGLNLFHMRYYITKDAPYFHAYQYNIDLDGI